MKTIFEFELFGVVFKICRPMTSTERDKQVRECKVLSKFVRYAKSEPLKIDVSV